MGGVGETVPGLGEAVQGAERAWLLVEAGEQEAGVDHAGDGGVDRDRGDDRAADDVDDVALGEGPVGLGDDDDPTWKAIGEWLTPIVNTMPDAEVA